MKEKKETIHTKAITALWEHSFNPASNILFFPIRHHSPAFAHHLQRTIDSYRPEIILIEGPDDTNHLIEFIVHEETEPPLAIYYSYADKQGLLADKDAKYTCYYPFLEYSPEYAALKKAKEQNIKTAFIDLPYPAMLVASKDKTSAPGNEKNNYHDDYLLTRSKYIAELCKKEHTRDFNELWEKRFEINGIHQETSVLVKNLLAFCYLARLDTPKEILEQEGCIARERYMASKIKEAAKTYGKVLVVTGGFHTPALAELVKQDIPAPKPPGIKKEHTGAFPLAYSFEESDLLGGYASGMPFPAFYQQVFENITLKRGPGLSLNDAPTFTPFQDAVLSFIIETGSYIRKKEGPTTSGGGSGVSTSDQIEAFNMAGGLKVLRNKMEFGVYELMDGVRAAFIKGETTISTDAPLMYLRKILTGRKIGHICSQADIPPIVADFRKQSRRYKLKRDVSSAQETVLSIYKSRLHEEKSCFFHTLVFLGADFCKMLKGPNFNRRENINLTREVWEYKSHPAVEANLIEVSVYGGTLKEAAAGLIIKQMASPGMDVEAAAVLLLDSFRMGLGSHFQALADMLTTTIADEGSFFAAAGCVNTLGYLFNAMSLTASLYLGDVQRLIGLSWHKATILVRGCASVPDSEEDQVISKLKDMYRLFLQHRDLVEGELFTGALKDLLENRNCNSAVEGATCGLLQGMNHMEETEIVRRAESYFFAAGEVFFKAAAFLKGLLATGRDILLCRKELLTGLDFLVNNLEEDRFLAILPNLRLAFSYFTPTEIQEVGEKVAEKYGLTAKTLLKGQAVNPAEVTLATTLDKEVNARLEGYGLC
ncbi:MAG: hypothetical protein GY765_38015 [bacterium]|nr:hypothetical protein [bacterium]